MKSETFTFKEVTGLDIFVYKWIPDGEIKAIVQIAHGMAEMALRYERFAEKLTAEGFLVYANDHRGHGQTAGEPGKVGDLGDDGFNNMVRNLRQLQEIIVEEYQDLPFFMFGHSMGSFVMQRYICLYGDRMRGVLLSGSNGREGFLLNIGRIISWLESKIRGRKARSKLMSVLTFGTFNKKFKPNRTLFDWLSRDEKEVDKFIEDPFCGCIMTAGFFYDFMGGMKLKENKKEIAKVPKELPIYIFSGDMDPVGKYGKGVMKLVNTYEELGIKDLQHKLYEGGRHEMLNETNRREVMQDVVDWLNPLVI
ncbi:MAG: alpha/beta hydrolase [bacterium]|nr:alpha/beta hydrolase [bacterium]